MVKRNHNDFFNVGAEHRFFCERTERLKRRPYPVETRKFRLKLQEKANCFALTVAALDKLVSMAVCEQFVFV